MAASASPSSPSSCSTDVTKNWPQRSLAPSSIASTGGMSPCPSAARAMAVVSSPRSRATTIRRKWICSRSPPATGFGSAWRSGRWRERSGRCDPRCDRHRRVVEERMKRTSAARCGSACSSRARLMTSVRDAPGTPSRAERQLVIQTHRHGLAAAHPQVHIEHFGLHFAGLRRDRCEQRCAVAGHNCL